MRTKRVVIVLAVLGWLSAANGASAQLFGERSLGRATPPRGRQTMGKLRSFTSGLFGGSSKGASSAGGSSGSSASPFAGVGMPDASARYMRGNRSASDFVGADSGDAEKFVGMEQAGTNTDQIRSAVDNVRVQTGPDANRTAGASARPRVPMYQPRLHVDFDFAPPTNSEVSSRLTRRLESSLAFAGVARVEVSVEGDTAILRGEVASERNRKLAGLLLRLEPGVLNVQNELAVKPPQSSPQPGSSTPSSNPASPSPSTVASPSPSTPAPQNQP